MFTRPEEPRGRMVDIDLLPQVYAPRRALPIAIDPERLFWALAAVGALLLALLFSQRSGVLAQLAEVEGKVVEAETRARILVLPREVRELQDKVTAATKRADSLEQDAVKLRTVQWPWGRIVQRIVELKPDAITLSSLAHKETGTVTLEGTTEAEAAVVSYAGRLRLSGLFSAVSIQSLAIKQVPVPPVPTPVLLGPAAPGAPGLAPFPLAPPTATPTPAFDYILVSQTRTAHPGAGWPHELRGQVLDPSGQPVQGLSFRVSSCCPSWSARYPRSFDTPAPGTFEFVVGPGTFTVEILSALPGRAQRATELHTADVEPDAYSEWFIVFQKVTEGPVPTPTPTPTFVPTPAGTPVLGPPVRPEARAAAAATATLSPPSPTPTPTATPALPLAPAATGTPVPGIIVTGTITPTAVPMREVLAFTLVLTLKAGGEAGP